MRSMVEGRSPALREPLPSRPFHHPFGVVPLPRFAGKDQARGAARMILFFASPRARGEGVASERAARIEFMSHRRFLSLSSLPGLTRQCMRRSGSLVPHRSFVVRLIQHGPPGQARW